MITVPDHLASQFAGFILNVSGPLLGVGAIWTLARSVILGLLTLPSLSELELSCAGKIEASPANWNRLTRMRRKLCVLTGWIVLVLLICLALYGWLQVLAPIPKAPDGVSLIPNAAQLAGCAAIVFLAVAALVLNVIWERRMRVHKEQIASLQK